MNLQDICLKADSLETILAAIQAAGLGQIVEAHTEDVPEHYAQNMVPASPEVAEALYAQFMEMAMAEFKETGSFPSPHVMLDYEGKTYYGTGDAWMVDEPVLVPAHQVEVPRHLVLPPNVRIDLFQLAGIDGYHANLLLVDTELTDDQLAALPIIEPKTRQRVWA